MPETVALVDPRRSLSNAARIGGQAAEVSRRRHTSVCSALLGVEKVPKPGRRGYPLKFTSQKTHLYNLLSKFSLFPANKRAI